METPGLMLKREREARGMTLSELSKVTRIPETSLEHIENNEFDGFPAEVFVRGFLRNYARQLSIPAEEIMQAYENLGRADSSKPEAIETTIEATPATTVPETSYAANDNDEVHTSFRFAYIAIIFIAVASIGMSMFFMGTSDAEETDADFNIQSGESVESPFLISNTSEGWIAE